MRRDGFGSAAGPGNEYRRAGRGGGREQAAARRSRGEVSRIGIVIGDGIQRTLAGLWPQGEWNRIAGLVHFVAGNISEEDTRSPANGGLAVTPRVIREAYAWRNVVVGRRDDAASDALIPREHNALGRKRGHSGLLAR